MKKPYQIEAQRAVKQFEAMAADGNPAVQMVLPMAEMVGWLRKGVGELIRQAGLQLIVAPHGSEPAAMKCSRCAGCPGFETVCCAGYCAAGSCPPGAPHLDNCH